MRQQQQRQQQQRSLAIVMLFRILTICLFFKVSSSSTSVDAVRKKCTFSEECWCSSETCNLPTTARCMNLHEIPQFSENDCQIISILLQGDFSSVSKDQFFMFKDTLKELIISTTSSQPLVIDDMAFNGLAISEIERLEIDAGGKMSEVPSAVQNLQKLNTLIINGTDIKSLNALFAKNTSLHTLRISNSQLMNIDLNAFTYLRFFTTLELPGNKLNQIPRDALVPVQKTLRSLDLSYNEITSVDNGAFVDFERLRQLNLSNNPIALVSNGAFAKSASLLSTLDLSHCQLESIPSGALVGLKLLRYLNVSSNRIAHLSEASFGNMTSLISVDLTNNPIKTVAVDAFYGASFPSVTLSNTELEQLDLAIFGTSTALRELQIFDSPSLGKLYANFSTSGSTSIDVELRNVGTLELDRSLFDWLLKPTFSLKIHPNETVHCDATSVGWLTAVVRCFGVMPLDVNSIYCAPPTRRGDDVDVGVGVDDAPSANKTFVFDAIVKTVINCEHYSTTTTTSTTESVPVNNIVGNQNNAGSAVLLGSSFVYSVAVVVVVVATTLVVS
ncbi:Leucine-rich repeats and immunoglobulin-like domains protein 3 [Trichinella sp. T6]|nr:Leucine-rich repeats and immunoglobulin-like domains protein 3 [Trichinella sp. T6]KRX74543.1 Leucine-rich repeats and immunoglobulin-like domains protein 3 [Trichinella sp. T6]KRX74545.1 Leucine-rich repeats and immunoglobulin-like domains protein 3 [Trichinella sp. T6]